jgi:Tfp pilus assembly protein PilW
MSGSRPDGLEGASRRLRPSRGFTIVEVLVALSAGVLVSLAAFSLSKSATAFFQREARISSAQLALTLAMNRLTGDIQRASFLSTPNIQLDPSVCTTTNSTWTAGLSVLSGITITPGPGTAQGAQQNPPLTPDVLVVGGSLSSNESFQVQSVVNGNGGPLVILRSPANEPATMRMLASLGVGETLTSKATPIFYPSVYPGPPVQSGRFARIYQPETNTAWYGVISTFVVDPTTGAIDIQLQSAPTLPTKPGSVCGIGIGDTGGGWIFSVVSRVQYDIRSLAGTTSQYAAMVNPTSPTLAQVTGDSGRTELVRTELDQNNVQIASTMEVVAEYAVDMRFGITVSSIVANNNYQPYVTAFAVGDPTVYTWAASIANGGRPELLRSVQVRLSTRTRAPDRDADLPAGPDGRRLHFLVDPSLQPAYARVRTIYANVALPNQGGFSLW